MSKESEISAQLNLLFANKVYYCSERKSLSKAINHLLQNGFKIADSIKFLTNKEFAKLSDYNSDLAKVARSNFNYEVGVALEQLCMLPEAMDDVLDYIISSRKITPHKFIDSVSYFSARCLVRKADGSMRSPEELGLIKSFKKSVYPLVSSAVTHMDKECLDHLRDMPFLQGILTDEYIQKSIVGKTYLDNHKEIENYFKDYIKEVDLLCLSQLEYWKLLESKKVFRRDTKKSTVDEFYRAEVFRRSPDGFVFNIMNLGRYEADKGNYLIELMQRDGIDCYDGFVLGLNGPLAAYDAKSTPRDYEWMINVCLQRKSLPGYLALLSGIPLPEIERHDRCAEVLQLIHARTGRKDVLKLMSRKGRGRALVADLGM